MQSSSLSTATCRQLNLIRDISEYAVSRILSPSRLPHVQVQRFVAHERILRTHRRSLSSCARDAVQTALLGSRGRWTLADRLAEDEQGRLTGSGFLDRKSTRLNSSHL